MLIVTRPEDERPRLPVTHWAACAAASEQHWHPWDVKGVGEAVLGHMQPGIVGVYNLHAYDAERRRWLTALSDHLETLAKRPPAAASLTLVETHTTPSPRARASRRAGR